MLLTLTFYALGWVNFARRWWVIFGSRLTPYHRSLDFKRVGKKYPTYSVRIGMGWRAVGFKRDNIIVWFWIGSHADYDRIIPILVKLVHVSMPDIANYLSG